jgi:hypothetical protein
MRIALAVLTVMFFIIALTHVFIGNTAYAILSLIPLSILIIANLALGRWESVLLEKRLDELCGVESK